MLDAAFDHVTEFQRWSNPAHYDTDFLEKEEGCKKKRKLKKNELRIKWLKTFDNVKYWGHLFIKSEGNILIKIKISF